MISTVDVRTARAQRRAARQRSHHLVTADETSFAELETFLATLPLCATGRVLIEVPSAEDIGHIDAPARMTVTWLARDSRSGAPGTGRACAPGEAIARAACAWADEMLCADSAADDSATDHSAADNSDTDNSDTATKVTLLGGYLGTADIVEHLTSVLGVPAASIYAPERFRLLPSER
jgi:hypothetical protein